MGYRAQSFPSVPLLNAYNTKEDEFAKTVKTMPIEEVPTNANVISSHVIYKVKVRDSKSLQLSRVRQKNVNEKLNEIEMNAFASINASIDWLCVIASALYTQVSIHLQQLAPKTTVTKIIQQANML